jgi:hypothetical protein
VLVQGNGTCGGECVWCVGAGGWCSEGKEGGWGGVGWGGGGAVERVYTAEELQAAVRQNLGPWRDSTGVCCLPFNVYAFAVGVELWL